MSSSAPKTKRVLRSPLIVGSGTRARRGNSARPSERFPRYTKVARRTHILQTCNTRILISGGDLPVAELGKGWDVVCENIPLAIFGT